MSAQVIAFPHEATRAHRERKAAEIAEYIRADQERMTPEEWDLLERARAAIARLPRKDR